MTEDAQRYVPVLKIKAGEKAALAQLRRELSARITPLLEIVAMKDEQLEKHLAKTFNNMQEATNAVESFFLDAREIAAAGEAGARRAFQIARQRRLPFVPVTGLSRTADVRAALSAASSTICIRLVRPDFEQGSVTQGLERFLSDHNQQAAKVHLVVDLGTVDDMIPDGIGYMARQFVAMLPRLAEWASLSLVASAFPMSMTAIPNNSADERPRSEWLAWRDYVRFDRRHFPRLPVYGDCAIQHPRGVEEFDKRRAQRLGQIRYARPDAWLIEKGQGEKKEPLVDQFPALATRLMKRLATAFDKSHCAGCTLIEKASRSRKGFGDPTAWRKIGTLHHITRTLESLADLPGQ